MDYIAIILYVVGLLGICLSIFMIGTRFHDKNKITSILTLLIIFISVISFGGGTVISLLEKKSSEAPIKVVSNEENDDVIPIESTSSSETNDDSTIDDLVFEYNIKNNQCYIDIKNTTSQVFNGDVDITILDNSNNTLSKAKLPLNNLIPNTNGSYNLLAPNANNVDYKFDGKFSNEVDNSKNYSISSMGIGNGYIRLQINPYDKSTTSLCNICNEFKNQYNKNYCNGFLIYFVNSNESSFNNSFAEYYCNNEGATSLLIIYDTNEKINI